MSGHSSTRFRKLLQADSSSALPNSDDDIEALFNLYQVRQDARPDPCPNSTRPTLARLELAAALLWFHTHVNDPAPALDRLSPAEQKDFASLFVPDVDSFTRDPKWQSKLAHFFKFTLPSGSTPRKRAARPSRARPSGGAAATGEQTSATRVGKGVPSSMMDDENAGSEQDDDGDEQSVSSVSGEPDFSAGGGAGAGPSARGGSGSSAWGGAGQGLL